MKRIIAVAAVMLFVLAAGMATAAVAAEPLKVGFINVDRAANESEPGKKAVSELTAFIESKRGVIVEKAKSIEKLRAELEKQAAIISVEAKKSKAAEIERLERELQRMDADARLETEKKHRELTESIYKEVLEVVEKIGQEEKYTMILPAQTVVFIDKTFDITDRVIKRYNETKKTTKK